MSCLAECAQDIVMMTNDGCTIKFAPGGFSNWGLKKCNVDFSDVSGGSVTDVATWQALIDDDAIKFSGKILGSKAAGTDTTTRVASCLPEVKTGSSKVYTITDYNSDETDFTEYDQYNNVQNNYASYDLLLTTCDERVFIFPAGTWAPSADVVIPQTKEEAVNFVMTVTVSELTIRKPVRVEGINSLLP